MLSPWVVVLVSVEGHKLRPPRPHLANVTYIPTLRQPAGTIASGEAPLHGCHVYYVVVEGQAGNLNTLPDFSFRAPAPHKVRNVRKVRKVRKVSTLAFPEPTHLSMGLMLT